MQESNKKSADETWIVNFDADVAKAETQRDDLSTRLVKEQVKLEELKSDLAGKTQSFQTEIEENQRLVAPLLETRNGFTSKLQVASSEHTMLTQKIESTKDDVESSALKLQELQDQLKSKKGGLKECVREINECGESLDIKTKSAQVY